MMKNHEEWIKQSKYDLKTAEFMFEAKRYFYVIFMCHLAIEKALKALVLSETKKLPPKTHDLIRLMSVERLKCL